MVSAIAAALMITRMEKFANWQIFQGFLAQWHGRISKYWIVWGIDHSMAEKRRN